MPEPRTFIRTTALEKYLSANSTNETLGEFLIETELPGKFIDVTREGYRSVSEIVFYGEGADGDDAVCRVYTVDRIEGPSGEPLYLLRLYGTAAFVLGDIDGVEGHVVNDDEKFADTIVWTLAPWGTHLESVFGETSAAFSPEDDSQPAVLSIPDMGDRDGLFLEFDIDDADSVNALVRRGA